MRIPQHLQDRGIESIVGLDFETFWSQDYTLKKSTTEYVRDSRFKAQCVGMRVHDQTKAAWCPAEEVAEALSSVHWSRTALLAHHTHFDGHILTHHYGHRPAYYLCTLSMARPLHGGEIRNDLDTLSRHYNGRGKHKDYLKDTKGVVELSGALMDLLGMGCAQDVDEMWRIFQCMLPHYPEDELDLIHHTVRAYVEPMLQVCEKTARVAHKIEVRRKRQLLERVALPVEVLRSREQFAGELRKLGVEPPMKVSPRTEKLTYAFAKDDLAFQELLEHLDPNVRDLVEARLAVSTSLEETRALRLLSHAKPALPIYLNYGKAHTLRWCLPGDAEVLTQDGWERLDQWIGGLILQWAPAGDMRWLTATNNQFEYRGDLVTFQSDYHDCAYTPEHKIPCITSAGNFAVRTAEEIAAHTNIRVCATGVMQGPHHDPLIRLKVAIQADGYFDRGRLVFKFRKRRKLERIAALLDQAGVKYKLYDTPPETMVCIAAKDCPNELRGAKQFGAGQLDLCLEDRLAFIDELQHWDGCLSAAGAIRYFTTNKLNAEWVATVAHTALA